RRALFRGRAGGGAQPATHSRQDRPGDHRLPGERHHRSGYADHGPDRGTIVQRKVGPGQYVGSGSTDPVFIIGDLSTVWVVAFIRETEAPLVHVGQAIHFTVLAYPDRSFPANISYVAAAFDPTIRRLLVRATVNNSAGLLKPEMFASVKILTGEGDNAGAVPRGAIIYEG